MKLLLLLPVLSSLCAALAVGGGSDTPLRSRTLSRRADSTSDNPDGEDDYEDPVSKTTTPRSRILPFGENGVNQPQEAKDRIFDWDMTCTDANDRQKIMRAFTNGLMLGSKASEALGALKKGLPKPAKDRTSNPVKENQNYIATEDPAYTQMFFAQDNRLDQVKEAFDLVVNTVPKSPNDRANGKGALRIICDKGGNVKDGNGDSYCGTGATAAQAVTNNAGNEGPIESKYVFAHSASIVFCPPFFDDAQFPNLEDIKNDFDNHKTLDKIDCRERIVLHELFHLKWTKNIYQPDEIGFLKAAVVAGTGSGNGRKPDWRNSSNNADSYAQYALYSYWNKLPNWGPDTCKNDAWPADPKKPNPTKF